jgi:hypothetical protein
MPPKHPIEVILLYGPSGCGKTQWFQQQHLREVGEIGGVPRNLLIQDPIQQTLASILSNPGEYHRLYVETNQYDRLREDRVSFTKVFWWKKNDGSIDGPTIVLPNTPEWEYFWSWDSGNY